MRLWKWVETSTLGQSSCLAIQCLRVAVSSDSPSFCGGGGGEGKGSRERVGGGDRRGGERKAIESHANVFMRHTYMGSTAHCTLPSPLTVAVPLPNSSSMIKDRLTHNLTADDTYEHR